MLSSGAVRKYLENFQVWLQDAGFELVSQAKPEIWNGIVSTEWKAPDTGHIIQTEHKVSVILPPAFPYNAPIVVSMDDPPLTPSWHLSPDPLNSLCLWDSQIGWKPHFSAQRLLKRIDEWFCHYHAGTWPSNSEVPDLHRYLENVGLVVTGDEWKPQDNKKSGRFLLWIGQRFSEMFLSLAICQENEHIQPHLQKPEERLSSNLPFIEKESKKLVGVWFRLTKPFVPPNNLKDLLCLIDSNLVMESGWASRECRLLFGDKMSTDGFPIAIEYTNSRNMARWLFLWAQLPSDGKKRHMIHWLSQARLFQIKLKGIQTAPAGKEDLLRRSAHVSKHLSSYRITIFGIGALGSNVAMLMAKAGIGEIHLVDDDTLMPSNVIRHICGLNSVGLKKTIAVEWAIRGHNPDCRVIRHDIAWDEEALFDYVGKGDIVIDTTANHNFSLWLNEVCIACNQPILFATTHRRATIGRLIVRLGSDDPCLACYEHASQFWNNNDYPVIPIDPEAVFIEDGCGAPTEEAVALDVEAVANLTARVTIKALQRQLDGKNLAIFVNEPIVGEQGPLHLQGLHLRSNTPLLNCSICHR